MDNRPIWTLTSEDAFQALASRPDGLDEAEVTTRREEVGPNRLPEAKPRSRLSLFASQFKSLLILLLIAAAVLALFIGQAKDAVVIGIVVLFNAVLEFGQ